MIINILIVTMNRPQKLSNCLQSIINNSFKDFRLFVVDQSDNNDTKSLIDQIADKRIHYFRMKKKGQGRGQNLILPKLKEGIIAFTDDDCLVDKYWLRNINQFFRDNKKIGGVFGKTLPYYPTNIDTINKICPSMFQLQRRNVVNDPSSTHYHDLGHGNNMAFRNKVLRAMKVREWLGPGSIAWSGALEGELIYLILKKGHILAYDPKIIIYHNRWLTYHQEKVLQGYYSCGQMAFYFFYLTRDLPTMKYFISNRFKERIGNDLLRFYHLIRKLNLRQLYYSKKEFLYIFWEFWCFIRGAFIGFYYNLKEK